MCPLRAPEFLRQFAEFARSTPPKRMPGQSIARERQRFRYPIFKRTAGDRRDPNPLYRGSPAVPLQLGLGPRAYAKQQLRQRHGSVFLGPWRLGAILGGEHRQRPARGLRVGRARREGPPRAPGRASTREDGGPPCARPSR